MRGCVCESSGDFGKNGDWEERWWCAGELRRLRTIPLACYISPIATIRQRVVVDGFFRVHFHVFSTCTPAVQARNGLDDLLLRWTDGY